MEQLACVEVRPGMNYQEIEKVVKDMLCGYPRLEGRIRILERQANGIGFGMYLDAYPSSTVETEDKLQLLHAKLRLMPEHMYLSQSEQHLAAVAKANLKELPLGTKSQLYSVRNEALNNPDPEEQTSLNRVANKIERIVETRGNVIQSVENAAIRRAAVRRAAELEVNDLRQQKDLIEQALASLKSYRPLLEQLLRSRYILSKSVLQVIRELNISEKTHDRWKKEAIEEFAVLAGISSSR